MSSQKDMIMVEWRTIPGWEAYEISSSGTVRRIATRYRMCRCGPSVRMWDGAHALYLPVAELLAKAFPGGRTPDAIPNPDALVWLRRRVAELEEEVATLRAAAQAEKPAKTEQKKRYCVVCGRELPPGYWRRCPEHAYSGEGGLSEDDFRGAVIH